MFIFFSSSLAYLSNTLILIIMINIDVHVFIYCVYKTQKLVMISTNILCSESMPKYHRIFVKSFFLGEGGGEVGLFRKEVRGTYFAFQTL